MTLFQALLLPLLLVLSIWPRLSLAARKLPPYIQPCKRNDPKLDDCVVRSARAAIPHFIHGDANYRVPNLDPLDIERVTVKQGTRQIGMDLTLSHCKLYGLGNALITESRTDLKKRHIEWDFVNEKGLQIIGPYNVSGQVLVVPITGSGPANITLTGLTVTYKFDFDLTKKNGKDYMSFNNSKLIFDVTGATFKLDNLFNGDRVLGPNMNRFLNENWKDLIKEVGPAVGNALGDVFLQLLTSIHGLVPYDEVYPPR